MCLYQIRGTETEREKERVRKRKRGNACSFFDESPLGIQEHLCDSQWKNNVLRI